MAGSFQRSGATARPLNRIAVPRREVSVLSKREQGRLATLRAADAALRREMQRLNVRFD